MKFIGSIFKAFLLPLAMIANLNFVYAQTASILPPAKTTFFDANGKPLSGGKVQFYAPGTTQNKTTWQDAGETVPNLNPVILDSAGRALILGSGNYRQQVFDANNNLIWDQLTSSNGGSGSSVATVGDGDLVGTVKPWAGMLAPNQYAFAYGQEFTRASFPLLFSTLTSLQNANCTSGVASLTGLSDTTNIPIGAPVESSCVNAGTTVISKTISSVGTSSNAILTTSTTATFFPFGNGNGSTTFNVPDLRGRVIAGRDNMGGVAASRLTTTYFGANASASGAVGGLEHNSVTLLTTNLPAYTPAGSVSVTSTGTLVAAANSNIQTFNAGGGTAFSAFANGTAASNTQNSTGTLTGSAQGGASTPILSNVVQPTETLNYIIKTLPDTNPNTFFGVASIGGMQGVLTCGLGITCAGNSISAVTPIASLAINGTPVTGSTLPLGSVLINNSGTLGNQSSWVGGFAIEYPNPNNNPGSGFANQVALNGFGINIPISATTTGGLQELDTQSATTGWPIKVSQFGCQGSPCSNTQFIGLAQTYHAAPRGIWNMEFVNTTSQNVNVDGTPGWWIDSAEIGSLKYQGQIVYGSTGPAITFTPTIATPNDHFIVFSLNDVAITTTVAISTSEAAIKFDPTTSTGLGIQQNVINFKEVNNGIIGIKVLNPAAVASGNTPVFSHNIITGTAIHGQVTAGVQVGQSTTRQAQMGANIWMTMFNSSAETDAFVTYEHNSAIFAGFDPTNTLTNGVHLKSGATNNIVICLDTAGATTPFLDDNAPASGSLSNIALCNGNITIGGFSVALQNSNNIFANAEVNNLQLKGSSTGFTTFTSANSSASNFTLTVPAVTDTMALIAATQTFTNKTYDTAGTGNSLLINGVAVTANTGTGSVARATSPVFVTPVLGVASATSLTSAINYGGSAAGSTLLLEGTSNGAPSGDYVQVTSTGATALTLGKICTGNAGFAGFAAGNTGQADCLHYSFMGDGTNSYFNAPTGGIISFRINNTETVRFFNSGGVAIGNTTDPAAGGLEINGQTFAPNMTGSVAGTDPVCWTTGTGKLTTATACTVSSRRYKENIATISPDDAIFEVMKLRPVSFMYKPEYRGSAHKGEEVGFIAEEVKDIDPRLMFNNKEGEPEGVRYQNSVAILVGAIQELKSEINDLRKRESTKRKD